MVDDKIVNIQRVNKKVVHKILTLKKFPYRVESLLH